jgi:hypothetical protein
MVASNAREVLKEENELLNKLADTASQFAKSKKGFSAENVNYWVEELRGYREFNEKLIRKDDAAFDKALEAEIALLEGVRDSIKGDSDAAQYWRAKLNGEIEPMKELL